MSEPFIGQIKMFAGNFAPRSWSFCSGQLLAISQNDALFSLLGTTYGGDGRTTFGLPDLRGRLPIHMGQGPGLNSRPIGQKSGNEQVTLAEQTLAAHTHESASTNAATHNSPGGKVLANTGSTNVYGTDATTTMAPATMVAQGAASPTPHTNVMPYQTVSFIICLFGVYPSRN